MIASTFVQELLHKSLEYVLDFSGSKIVIGDGINLGGDRDWATAVAGLVKQVHAADGEFEEVILCVVQELARPCRERSADFMDWLHCLAVTGLVLENTKSLHVLRGKAIEPVELLNALLLPGAKHLNLDVQRVAVRCLGLYGLLERQPSEEIVKQLSFSFAKDPSSISLLASKGLIDLVMWHGPQEVDIAIGQDFLSQVPDNGLRLYPRIYNNIDVVKDGVLFLLYVGLESDFIDQTLDGDENESVQATLAEGFAKILLLSENYPSMPGPLHSLILTKLITLYFSEENIEQRRLKQCLSVFFEHYPSLLASHKKHLSKAFLPVLRVMWPEINGNHGASTAVISNTRKRAVQASRFMLQMIHSKLYKKETDNRVNSFPEENRESVVHIDEIEAGEESPAIRIATEVVGFQRKKIIAEKSYISALCKTIVSLHFRVSEQGTIKLMRRILNRVAGFVSYDKELVKELSSMAKHLKELDGNPGEDLSRDKAVLILGRLDLEYNIDDHSSEIPPTPVSHSIRPTRSRRSVQHEESSSGEEESSACVVPSVVQSGARSQRANKTAALTKMIAGSRAFDDIDEEEVLDATSEEEANDFCTSAQWCNLIQNGSYISRCM